MTYLATLDIPLDRLTPFPGNPRQGNVAVIEQSLRTNAQYRAIVVQATDPAHPAAGGTILAGNHTWIAARNVGMEHIRAELHDVDDETARRIVAVDNRAADLGTYDDRLLAELLAGLDDLTGTGYDETYLLDLESTLLEEEPLPATAEDPDDQSPNPPPDPRCKSGDVWHLGQHRLVVGDSTDPAVWDLLLQNGRADMIWTDPPYGVAYVGKTAEALSIANDDLDGPKLREFLRGALGLALTATKPGACWYVAAPAGPASLHFMDVLQELGVLRQGLVWVKDTFVLGRSDYHYRHEMIYYGWTPGGAHHSMSDRGQDSVHEVARPRRSTDHPTMKPVALIARHITNSTAPQELVVDPFGGSGSTLLAAHTTGRKGAVIELDPRYGDVICRRYQQLTGDLPQREGDAVDFLAGGACSGSAPARASRAKAAAGEGGEGRVVAPNRERATGQRRARVGSRPRNRADGDRGPSSRRSGDR